MTSSCWAIPEIAELERGNVAVAVDEEAVGQTLQAILVVDFTLAVE
jgi:hypothetical protein